MATSTPDNFKSQLYNQLIRFEPGYELPEGGAVSSTYRDYAAGAGGRLITEAQAAARIGVDPKQFSSLMTGAMSTNDPYGAIPQSVGIYPQSSGGGLFGFISSALDSVGSAVGKIGDFVSTTITNVMENPLPTIATIALTAVGVPAPIANGLVTAATGGSLEDVALSIAAGYAGGMIGGAVGAALDPTTGLAMGDLYVPDTTKEFYQNILVNVSDKASTAALQGKDFDGVLAAGVTGAVASQVSNTLVQDFGLDPNSLSKNVISNAVAGATRAILTNTDPADAIASAVGNTLVSSGLQTLTGGLQGVGPLPEKSQTIQFDDGSTLRFGANGVITAATDAGGTPVDLGRDVFAGFNYIFPGAGAAPHGVVQLDAAYPADFMGPRPLSADWTQDLIATLPGLQIPEHLQIPEDQQVAVGGTSDQPPPASEAEQIFSAAEDLRRKFDEDLARNAEAENEQTISFEDGSSVTLDTKGDVVAVTDSDGQTIDLGAGEDTAKGTGADTLVGGTENDTLVGATGVDTTEGGEGVDTTEGGEGVDTTQGAVGVDTVEGGEDTVAVEEEPERIAREVAEELARQRAAVADTITGGEGEDTTKSETVVETPVDGEQAARDAGFPSEYVYNLYKGDLARYQQDEAEYNGFPDWDTYLLYEGDAKKYQNDLAVAEGWPDADTKEEFKTLERYAQHLKDLKDYDDRGKAWETQQEPDTLIGGEGTDTVGGVDTLVGGEGTDTVSDVDTLIGGEGTDTLVGGEGTDTVGGVDTLVGGEGTDTVSDVDTLIGGEGTDTLVGGEGTDTVSDVDTLIGGEGTDTVSDVDTLIGGEGTDTVSDVDTLIGGEGTDTVSDVDTLVGGEGTDTVSDVDTLVGGEGTDTVSDVDTLVGGEGTDTVSDVDTLIGGEGTDTLVGGEGTDTVSDVDTLIGGEGTDTVSDVDTLIGGDENDTLVGGEGTDTVSDVDTLIGGEGTDTLVGGDENDTLIGGDGNDDLDDLDDDTLKKLIGDDTLEGGDGNDLIEEEEEEEEEEEPADTVPGGQVVVPRPRPVFRDPRTGARIQLPTPWAPAQQQQQQAPDFLALLQLLGMLGPQAPAQGVQPQKKKKDDEEDQFTPFEDILTPYSDVPLFYEANREGQ